MSAPSFDLPQTASLPKRILRMIAAWAVIGAAIGAWSGIVHGRVGETLAGAVAGLLVLPPVGAVLLLFGGRARESLIGGVCGVVVWLVVGLIVGEPTTLLKANHGLMVGALTGATCWPYTRAASWVLARLGALASGHRPLAATR